MLSRLQAGAAAAAASAAQRQQLQRRAQPPPPPAAAAAALSLGAAAAAPSPSACQQSQPQQWQHRRLRRVVAAAAAAEAAAATGASSSAAAAAASSGDASELVASVAQLFKWLEARGAAGPAVEPKRFRADGGGPGERVGLIATRDVPAGEPLLVLPEALAVTAVDAERHPLVGGVAKECGSELVALTLWLLAERARGAASEWAPLLRTLPEATASPVLWEDADRAELLRGSPTLEEARARAAAVAAQWRELHARHLAADAAAFDPAVFNEAAFARAFSVVLACAAYLPSAECFALVPGAAAGAVVARTGNGNGADLDFDAASGTVVVVAARPYREGQEVALNDGRPNGELLLATGALQDANTADCLQFPAALVPADRLYAMKAQVLESFGFGPQASFPVFADRFPVQLLAYLRLARIQDPAQFASVAFDADTVVSELNEYEVLQLLMGDCREALARYAGNLEDDQKLLQRPDLSARERLAARLRLCEKQILSGTMDAVRRRLAPIRGIPTKGGAMTDPNADIREVFDFIDGLPQAPAKLFDGLRRWAAGEFDPDWKRDERKGGGKGGGGGGGRK